MIGAPFDAHMTLRGMRTLDLRVGRAQDNAAALVDMLNDHDGVETVYYPGLPSHTGYDVAQRQQSGGGAMLSFTLRGDIESAKRFVDTVFCRVHTVKGP